MKNKLFISMLPLKTERLIIRIPNSNDVDLMLKMDKQEETQKFLGGIKNRSRKERAELIKAKEEKNKSGYASLLTVCLLDGTPIGFTGLSINEELNCGKLSYLYDYDFTNKGYCTEACHILIDTAFNTLKLEKVCADFVDGNIASMRVLKKLGFKLIGSRKEDVLFHDYELLINDYKISKNHKKP